VAADQAKFLAVERPVKVPNVFRFEVGDLLSRRTVEGLKPEVVYVLVTDRIDDGFAILSEVDIATLRDRALQVYKFRILWRIDRDQCQLLLGDTGGGSLKEAKTLPPQFDASRDVVEQLQAVSKDGAKVPYFVVHRKDLKYDGNNPTLLYAYGGFQVSVTPTYSATLGKLWLERGGAFVLANIRGGGEFGPAWHEAGLKTNRQRIYDDFAAVGQDLVTRKITSRRRLGIWGGSNGGLLVGVEMTQHPEMWNAAVIDVPLLDMLRFEQIAAGASWVGEYGTVSIPEQRAFLASISPYNQLRPDVDYPEPLIFTTTKDDRVGPVHARKFAARMEEFRKPFFYDEIIEGGHASGADLKEQAKTTAVRFTYLTRKLMD